MSGRLAAIVFGSVLLGVALPATAGTDYRLDFDYPGMGDDWYGRSRYDIRRDFPAHPVELASDGDDFGRGFDPRLASPGSRPPLARTDGPGSAYVYFFGAFATSGFEDCDGDGVSDADQLLSSSGPCDFPIVLLDNGTTAADSTFLGPPDDVYYGVGGQIVTWEVACGHVFDGPGPDITVYEVDTGSAEFGAIDVLASLDGVTWFSLKTSETVPVRLPGDGAVHVNDGFARSYDLAVAGLPRARYVRVDGNGTGASGASTGFDLDAVGFVWTVPFDCDSSGALDACEPLQDCDGDGVPEGCEQSMGTVTDCNFNGTPDACDTLGGANDCDGDGVPDSCEVDCNANAVPDDCDLLAMTSGDCNGNAIPDECDLATITVNVTGRLEPVGYGWTPTWTLLAPFPAASDVVVRTTALADLDATGEYVDLALNATPLGRVGETAGQHCVATPGQTIVAATTFNQAVAGGDAVVALTASATVSAFECDSSADVTFVYAPVVDCNANGTLDACDIAGAVSTDLNLNGIADECEADCNANLQPDDYDIAQGLSPDCNANAVPDECDVAGGGSNDCNADTIPDECQVDCNANGVPDDCDLATGTSQDCDGDAVPDECFLAFGAFGCSFPQRLSANGTTAPDATFLGPPDDTYFGLGGQAVVFELDCGFIVDGPGPDFTVYETDAGSPEFGSLGEVEVSADGVTFVSVHVTESPAVAVPGDDLHGSDTFARSYDLSFTGLNAVRFVRIDGAGTGPSGAGTGFDLDAIGVVHEAGLDCDGTGVLDRCESFTDCNGNALPDACEISSGLDDDCDANGDLDACDIFAGASDVDADWIPDLCEPDCNLNAVPDHFDIEQNTSTDCNGNVVPDECDLSSGASQDCNGDAVPDECPLCPTVELVFVLDTSSSMSNEGAALCSSVQQVIVELQNDLVDVDAEILGILQTPGGSFSCITDNVGNLYGTAVPGTPPVGQETLGDPCGANLNEDWALATSIVAGLKPWQADSVRLIVPISDEGPRCGDPVNDPGDDRDAILYAIGQAQAHGVIVSPIAGDGASAAVKAMMDLIAGATGGQSFSSQDPSTDLPTAIRDVAVAACDSRGDCNGNDVPDSCDLAAMTSQDCDLSGTPDECEMDCNGNGLRDSCDLANMTSLDANANLVPDECEGIVLTAGPSDWAWTSVTGALGYDLIRGDGATLHATGGDFGAATQACVVNDTSGQGWPLGPDPSAGALAWYLVRGVLGSGGLTYDSFGAGLAAGRDAAIASSGSDCP